MIKIICDICKKEVPPNGPRIMLQLCPSIMECETTYRLNPCEKCFEDIRTKIELEGYDRI